MEEAQRVSAERVRSLLRKAELTPERFRAELAGVPAVERDAWFDWVLSLDVIPEDGPSLPRSCTPYLPCSVEALLGVVEHARVDALDVFVDLGSGLGRAAAFVQLCTGASVIGVEIQPELVRASRELARRVALRPFSVIEGDAPSLAGRVTNGTIFFLYCPFSGERLEQTLDGLEPIARTRQIRVCCVDVPLPPRPWLATASCTVLGVTVHESTFARGVKAAS